MTVSGSYLVDYVSNVYKVLKMELNVSSCTSVWIKYLNNTDNISMRKTWPPKTMREKHSLSLFLVTATND